LAIKISLKKLNFEGGVANFFTVVEENGFKILPLKDEHVKRVEKIPFLHRDPFDRMLIASAMFEGMRLISADTSIQQYDVSTIW